MRAICIAVAGIVLMTIPSAGVRASDEDVTLQGGDTSVAATDASAFEHSSPNIADAAAQLLHDVGETGFLRDFSRVKIRGAIRVGPTFNAPSCVSCHRGNGRGELRITKGREGSDTVLKISLAQGTEGQASGPIPVPGIGLQLRDHAVRGHPIEGRLRLTWSTISGTYDDGTPYQLRFPHIAVRGLRRWRTSKIHRSLRRAPPVVGSGLIDALPPAAIEAHADPFDTNGDGISGRVNLVRDVQTRSLQVGRFGFKAGAPTLKQQIAAAYATDMGVSNPLFRMRDARPEISAQILDATTFYTATLGMPMARNQRDFGIARGRSFFAAIGCQDCHTSTFVTGSGIHTALSNQTIHPFSDFLLHDMGAGLSDDRPEFQASGSEWRTTPLWGIGLSETVLQGRPATYLHDGRAQTLEEAILWHGGEAAAAQARFKALSASERDVLIRFLRSL